MQLTVLGSGGGWPRPGRAASGYLLRHDGFTLWLDAGTGTMANLQEHVELLQVDAIVVSHRHFDHFLDLYPYFLALWFDPRRERRIPLFAPPGMFEHAMQIEENLAEVLEPHAVGPGDSRQIGPFRLRTAPMEHPVPTLGMRFEADGKSLVYTADTGPSHDLVQLARGVDLLLSEATWLERPPNVPMALHMTAREAGEHARKAEVGRLMLTHIWPTNDRTVAVEEAERGFGPEPVGLAEQGMVVDP
jgi:ribonuclease BN (tRNA processing enzyme)